ncbi:flagellar biosynthetic protein FliO [Treponema socranskii]|uniref:flagellar biosynthetic protein FliO n=1 Tax=Treponema socranskii TaxID=53419 RepID=UPI003D7021AB
MQYSKLLKTAAFSFLLLAVSLSLYAQTQVTEDTRIERTESAVVDESSLPIADPALSPSATERPSSTLWLFIRMILVLAVVVACVYAVVYLMKRSMNKDVGEGDQFLRVVSSVSLAPGKSVHVVSLLDDKAYLIGVTDNAVNLIGEVTDKETIHAMNLYADTRQNVRRPRNFGDILSIFMPQGTKKDESVFSGDGDKARDMLRAQRSRLDSEN